MVSLAKSLEYLTIARMVCETLGLEKRSLTNPNHVYCNSLRLAIGFMNITVTPKNYFAKENANFILSIFI